MVASQLWPWDVQTNGGRRSRSDALDGQTLRQPGSNRQGQRLSQPADDVDPTLISTWDGVPKASCTPSTEDGPALNRAEDIAEAIALLTSGIGAPNTVDPGPSSETPLIETALLLEPEQPTSGVLGRPEGSEAVHGMTPTFDGILVSWRPGSTAAERASTRAALGLGLQETIHTAAMKSSGAGVLEWVTLPPSLSAEQAISALSRRPGVAYAEKNWLLAAQATSNDPYATNGNLWGMYGNEGSPANPYGSQATEAWAAGHTGSSTVYVGIIDEGYQYTHPDLIANAGTNPGEIAANGKDDDGNGYVDDVYGWDFAGNNNTVYDGTSDDHGTHVAGTIGAKGGNGAGVAGVNWDVKLLSGKFLGSNGGTTANAIKAVDYFTDLKNKGVNIVATNNSWGGGGYSQGLADAISRANQADILFIAAAGNGGSDGIGDNNDNVANYPSNYNSPNVIAVAAITSSGTRSSFSNYGASTVDLGAPGSGIWSTVPNNSYASYSGTSMAAPHVAGAAALLLSIHPTATGAQIKQALLEGAAPTSSLAGQTLSGGRLDIPSSIARLEQIMGTGSTTALPVISINVPDSDVSESGPNPGTLQLARTGDVTEALIINLLWQGTATNGIDYSSQSTTVSFAAGSSTLDLTLTPQDDTLYEGSETVVLKLATGAGYSISPSANSATLTIADNESAPVNPEFWGTDVSETVKGDAADNIIGGVTKDGPDTGRGRTDALTGLSGRDTFVLADARRGTFYNDGNSRSQGTSDYAMITDLNSSEGDRLQLRQGSQYLIRNSGSDTELFLGDGNKTFSSSDEFIARIQGRNLASGTGVFILGTNHSWTTFV